MAGNSADKIAQLFSFIEKDSEGAFTKTKLKELLEKSVGESVPQEEIDKLFDEMNADYDGKVSLSNFVSAMLNKENVPNIPLDLSQLENVFKNIDQTKAGQMGVEDWQKILNGLGIALSEAEVSQVMKIACGLMQQFGVLDTSLLRDSEPSAGTAISGDETKDESIDATLMENLTMEQDPATSEQNDQLKQE